MTNPATKRAARRAIDRAGRDVTLRNYDLSESGGRQERSVTSSSPHTITARVERSGGASTDRDIRETGEPTADVTIYVADDDSGVGSIRDGGGRGASEIDVDNETYLVVQNDDQDNGLLALECERQT